MQQQVNLSNSVRAARAWKTFQHSDRARIDDALLGHAEAACPRCGESLVARQETRLRAVEGVPPGSYDLDCRECRRFHTVVPPECAYLLRMRRLATAVLHA